MHQHAYVSMYSVNMACVVHVIYNRFDGCFLRRFTVGSLPYRRFRTSCKIQTIKHESKTVN